MPRGIDVPVSHGARVAAGVSVPGFPGPAPGPPPAPVPVVASAVRAHAILLVSQVVDDASTRLALLPAEKAALRAACTAPLAALVL